VIWITIIVFACLFDRPFDTRDAREDPVRSISLLLPVAWLDRFWLVVALTETEGNYPAASVRHYPKLGERVGLLGIEPLRVVPGRAF
jgi:hypothetical protein